MKLKVRGAKTLPLEGMEKILVRGTNWIGDVVMTLPALEAIRATWPESRLFVLAKPWVAELYRLSPAVDEVIVFAEPGRHAGITGRLRLARELMGYGFSCAILLQNAIEAAIIAFLARIPLRAGYNSDGRGMLLTHSVRRTREIRQVHQVDYYLAMVRALGCRQAPRGIRLAPGPDYSAAAGRILAGLGIDRTRPLVGMAPGAAYGPAKRWLPERFAAVADRLKAEQAAEVVLLGSRGDQGATAEVLRHSRTHLHDLAGRTDLKEALALIAACDLFISNDSGLMHAAGALGVPLVAIFGSTNPAATSPPGEGNVVIHHPVECGPCLKEVCPTDFRCMNLVTAEEVYEAARRLLAATGRGQEGRDTGAQDARGAAVGPRRDPGREGGARR